MLAEREAGKVECDHCQGHEPVRGRNYLRVRILHGNAVPPKGVRFIAVNDNVDSANGVWTTILSARNLFNEWLVRDTSKKIKAVKEQRHERQARYQQASVRLPHGRG